MGNLEPCDRRTTETSRLLADRQLPNLVRSVGHGGRNREEDVRLVALALHFAGLLRQEAAPTLQEVVDGIRRMQRLLRHRTGNRHLPDDGLVQPDDATVRSYRLALSLGVLDNGKALEHRPEDPHRLIRRGLMQAHERLEQIFRVPVSPDLQNEPSKRCMLPPVDPAVFVANRRLAKGLASGQADGRIDRAIAKTLSDDGRQGFANVRDFFTVLAGRDSARARKLIRKASRRLRGKAKLRAIKLLAGEPPFETDFD